jgi:hypothetical protein
MIIDSVRNQDFARLSNRFQASSDVDPVTKDVAVLLDHITDVYSDPELDPALLVGTLAALSHTRLDLKGAPHGIDGTSELGQAPVSSVLEDPPVVGRNGGIEQLAPDIIESIERALFIGSDQPTEANYIRR